MDKRRLRDLDLDFDALAEKLEDLADDYHASGRSNIDLAEKLIEELNEDQLTFLLSGYVGSIGLSQPAESLRNMEEID